MKFVSAIGAGGMGEGYRARDTRLGRTVAIKILPKEMSSDPLRKQRFEREAETISSLNHRTELSGDDDQATALAGPTARGSFAGAQVESGEKNERPFRLPASCLCESYRGHPARCCAVLAVGPTPSERETLMSCRLRWPSKEQPARTGRRFLEQRCRFRRQELSNRRVQQPRR